MPGRDSEFWKYAAIFLASMLFLSNAAHYYSRQVMKAELASYQSDSGALAGDSVRESPEAADEQQQMEDAMHSALTVNPKDEAWAEAQLERMARDRRQKVQQLPNVALKADERCISGQRFRRLVNGWEEIGIC